MTPDALLSRFAAQGMPATAAQSVHELADEYGVGENRLLGLVFLPERAEPD